MDGFDALIILNFIQENWSAFEDHCDEYSEDAEAVIKDLEEAADK